MSTGDMPRLRFFYGLQPRWFKWDRLYRIYISDRMLAGAYVAGQFYDEHSAALQLQQMGPILSPLVQSRLAQRRERETLYDSVEPFGNAFLQQDERNFQISRSEVVRTRFRRNRSYWTPFNVGVLELELLDGKKHRFILVGDQQPDEILMMVQRFDPLIDVTGKPNPRPYPKAMSPAVKRRNLAVIGILLMCFAGLFGYLGIVGIDGNVANPIHLPMAVVNGLAGLWTFMRAWKMRRSQPQENEANSAPTKR
jgi:hypothetical protein